MDKYLNSGLIAVLIILTFRQTLAARDGGVFNTQDGYLIENSLQTSEREMHLEDFFWTGSGDGPPPFNRHSMYPITDSKGGGGRDTIIRTATVVATVYVDGNMESNNLCMYNCDNSNVEPIVKILPNDRRYWLLTVVAGFFGPQDFPILEDKLAKLYRLAFTRQQARHLGFVNGQNITNAEENDKNVTRTKRDVASVMQLQIKPTRKYRKDEIHLNQNVLEYERHVLRHRKKRIVKREASNEKNIFDSSNVLNKNTLRNIIYENGNTHLDGSQQVSVLIHNVTLISDEELSYDLNSSYVRTAGDSGNVISNQTEIIYSVFVGATPILAVTAADDMKLLTEVEIFDVMENTVYTKAEPYLREPQATPLVPSTYNGNTNIVAVIGENPFLFIVACGALILLVLLLISLLLLSKTKRKRNAELNRLTKTLVSESQNGEDTLKGHNEGDVGGVENLAFEKEQHQKAKGHRGDPVLHFPLPPLSRPTSSSSTSDSSVYYPKRRSKLNLHEILDEKAANLFNKKTKMINQSHDDNLYATVIKSKDNKKDKLKHKNRRKYLNENRVGLIEEVQIHSTRSSISSDNLYEQSSKLSPSFEHNEAFNPNVGLAQYNRNKVMHDSNFTLDGDSSRDGRIIQESPSEAINREIIRNIQKCERYSAETGSIGSYLSMASVKSFPRCSVPEPLSRVLEPVSVTHLDQSDADLEGHRTSRKLESILKINNSTSRQKDVLFTRSQSDGADPGVIGPVVWEIHKKEMENKDIISPIHDPVISRNRFEGLLEGAIKLYGNDDSKNEDDSEMGDDMPGIIKTDFRGKSAINLRTNGKLSRNGSANTRPLTAGPSKCSIDKSIPPSPSRAWSSGSHSPLVRPMSAGPFHKPQTPNVDVTRILAPKKIVDKTTLSTAPLIEAIQNELKKFNKK